jgi:4-hydroxy-tetrahydrodipicolinate synthase
VARISAMRRICLPHIKVFSGLDATLLGAMAHGADGIVSLTANVAPHLVRSVYDAALANDWERARRAHERLLGLHRLVAEDPVPSALKFVLARGGRCAADVRLPITPCLPETAMRARTILEDLGLAVADDRHQRSSDARDLTHATEAG